MENNPKIVPTIWTVAHYENYSEIHALNGNDVCILRQEKQGDRIAICSFIVTACNNYQALKDENESLTTQLAKANSDKEKLGELLKEEWHGLNDANVTYEQDGATNDAWYIRFKEKADQIKQTLQDCGITL